MIESTLFQGGGEMGRRIREYDWASTAVGPIRDWPTSLVNALNIVLSSRFPMFIWWGSDLIQFYNDAYRPSLGNTGKHPAALGQRGEECWPEIWPVIYPLIQQVINGEGATWSEDQLIPIYRNGRLEDVYWTFSYSPIIDEKGAIRGVLVVCSENTEKVLAFHQLKESEDLLSFAIEAAELGTWDYNPGTGKFSGNARVKNWFGLAVDEQIDLENALTAITPKDRTRVSVAIQQALQYQSGGFYDIRYSIVNKLDGKERIVRAKGRAWFNEDRIAYRFNGTLQDVTEQESADERLRHAQHTARLAIESADLGVYEIDLETDVVTSSQRFNSILGIQPPLLRKNLTDLLHPDYREVQTLASRESLITGVLNYEARIIRTDKEDRWLRIKGVYTFSEDGRPKTLTGIIQDITIEKQAEEKLTELVAIRTNELQRSNEDLMQFAHVISHDLKEPVRKIKLYADRINEEMPDALPPRAGLYLEKIHHSAVRMYSMIDGVLNYSSLNASHEPFETLDLNEIVRNAQTDLEVIIHEKQARIDIAALPSVNGIRVLIRQLFYNLLNNSLKFSQANVSPVIKIYAEDTTQHAGAVNIVIADNGIGFDPAYQTKIFESFTRLNSKDRYEGTGLGLSLCKKIIHRHGGQIHATSNPGQGATIHFSLPLAT